MCVKRFGEEKPSNVNRFSFGKAKVQMFLKNLLRWDDPYTFHFRMLALVGAWRVDATEKRIRISYSVFRFLILFSFTHVILTEVVDIFLLLDDIPELTGNLCTSVLSIVTLIRLYSMLYKSKRILSIDEHFRNNLYCGDTCKGWSFLQIANESHREIVYITKIFFLMAIPTAIFWIIFPLIDNSKFRKFPIPYRIPIDTTETPSYEILYVYLSLSLLPFMVVILCSDLIFFGFIIRINQQYAMLGKNLQNLSGLYRRKTDLELLPKSNSGRRGDFNRSQKAIRMLKSNLQHHQAILRQVGQIKEVYRSSLFNHVTAGSLLLCVVMFDVIKTNNALTLQQFQRSLYVGCILFDLFFFCYYGSLLEEKSLQLVQDIYDTCWPEMDVTAQRMIVMFMMRAQKVPKIMAGKTIAINLKTFLNILRASYNSMALLRQTMD